MSLFFITERLADSLKSVQKLKKNILIDTSKEHTELLLKSETIGDFLFMLLFILPLTHKEVIVERIFNIYGLQIITSLSS